MNYDTRRAILMFQGTAVRKIKEGPKEHMDIWEMIYQMLKLFIEIEDVGMRNGEVNS